MVSSVDAKESALLRQLGALDGLVVAFSGGVDSAVLLHAGIRALGRDRVVAVTARSASLPAAELTDAARVTAELDAVHEIVDTDELARPGYRQNDRDRCYHCKAELFDVIDRVVRAVERHRGWSVAFGAIVDDLSDHRPGARAAMERGVLAPLADAGFDKAAVRAYARAHGISVADKPSFACLASRIPYGTEVHAATLSQLERAEAAVRALGFEQFRVRHHGTVARLEVEPQALPRALELRTALVACLREAGYTYVSLDLVGYRTGAMNEVPR
ncbi:MAG: ATP-dependent sacrificial sulfur transferase LarE [Planctomycetota bacterium]|nr:ATP-dependent sacrificial sulfur transferase LarE [Planctomycetota bacterium]